MSVTNSERELLERAVDAVHQATGLQVRFDPEPPAQAGADGLLRVGPDDRKVPFLVKKWAQHANLGVVIARTKGLAANGLLVADYVNRKMAAKLRQEGVQFIDTAGNAYINQPPVYIYVTANPPKAVLTVEKPGGGDAGRPFEPKGLMVVYALLLNPDLVNAPYREVARIAGVAVGTVGAVLNGLKTAGFLVDTGRHKGRRVSHYRKLFDRWVEAWPEKLRPKQQLGIFMADDPYWWEGIELQRYGGYWGGEIAGFKYTGYLKPQSATVYLPQELVGEFIRENRLRKAINFLAPGITIYRPFWSEELDTETGRTKRLVHPILAYADLIATGDPRNIETAQKIYDEYIDQYCREG